MIYSTAPLRKLRPLTRSIAIGSRTVKDTCTTSSSISGTIPKSGGYVKRSLWSNSISFSSPESDFSSHVMSISPQSHINEKVQSTDLWSESISFSSPESDFTSRVSNESPEVMKQARTDEKVEINRNEWSGLLSFSSPESDFTMDTTYSRNRNNEDLEANPADFIDHIPSSHHYRDSMAYSLSFGGVESEFCSSQFMNLLDERMKRQLDNVTKQMQKRREDLKVATNTPSELNAEHHEAPLPSTYACATKLGDSRAIVVTEASSPHRIVSVNAAWEQLCGFSAAECHGKTLECLQGPETDQEAISALMAQLKTLTPPGEAGTVLTNYTKNGRKFRNKLTVGPLVSDNEKMKYVVGVLTELIETEHQFSNSVQKINKLNA